MNPTIIKNRLILTLAVIALGIGAMFADEKTNAANNEIWLGMDLNAAKQILKEYKIENEVLFELVAIDRDIIFSLDCFRQK